MANWLQKILPTAVATKSQNLPMQRPSGQMAPRAPVSPERLPNASLIYGMAASSLFVVAVYFLFTGRWFTGFLVLLPAVCFMGFALYFLRAK